MMALARQALEVAEELVRELRRLSDELALLRGELERDRRRRSGSRPRLVPIRGGNDE